MRQELVKQADEAIPVFALGMVVDLMTQAVLARRTRGTSALPVIQLASRVPALIGGICEALAVDGDVPEMLELTAARSALVIAVVEETREALVVIADRAQPTTQIATTSRRLVTAYAARRQAMELHSRS
jgi:hypothetical protein